MGAGAAVTGRQDVKYKHLLHPGAWWKNPRLIRLNCCILLLLITSSTNGYDGSMMNGLQSLPQWKSAFNNPQGGMVRAIVLYIDLPAKLVLARSSQRHPKHRFPRSLPVRPVHV